MKLRTVFVVGALAAGIMPVSLASANVAPNRTVHCVEKPGGPPVAPEIAPLQCATTSNTIAAGIAAAAPGDAVIIGVGEFAEQVTVLKDDLIIRGVSRHGTVMRGYDSLDIGDPANKNDDVVTGQRQRGLHVKADGVEVSNMSFYGYSADGVQWLETTGYLGQYLTAWNNRRYGLYAFDSQGTPTSPGIFRNSFGSGNPDSAFYIGECNPCYGLITDSYSYMNGLGYSGTNASQLTIEDTIFDSNIAGIGPNTLDSEAYPPQGGSTIRNNTVIDTGIDPEVPCTSGTCVAEGIGIVLPGVNQNVVYGNTITGYTRYGVAVIPFPNENANIYQSNANAVKNNFFEPAPGALFDIAMGAGSGDQNCFSGNKRVDGSSITSDPPMIETLFPCSVGTDNLLRNIPVVGGVSSAEIALGLITRPNADQGYLSYVPDPRPTSFGGSGFIDENADWGMNIPDLLDGICFSC